MNNFMLINLNFKVKDNHLEKYNWLKLLKKKKQSISLENEIKGAHIGKKEVNLSLITDDIILFI